MNGLLWEHAHAVFVPEIDDEHQEIFRAANTLREHMNVPAGDVTPLLQHLAARIEDHFAHEERLMHAARYEGYRWHRSLHDTARRRVGEYASNILRSEPGAIAELLDYLTGWMDVHMHSADAMLGAFLRNHRRLAKVTIRRGTKPVGACTWTDSNGNQFDPTAPHSGY